MVDKEEEILNKNKEKQVAKGKMEQWLKHWKTMLTLEKSNRLVQTQGRKFKGSGKGVYCVGEGRDKCMNKTCRQFFLSVCRL